MASAGSSREGTSPCGLALLARWPKQLAAPGASGPLSRLTTSPSQVVRPPVPTGVGALGRKRPPRGADGEPEHGPANDTGAQLLFRFVAAAYECRAPSIGSHWPFESWGRFLPEHATAVSMLDRLLDLVDAARKGTGAKEPFQEPT